MESWLEAYAKWSPLNQLAFSAFVMTLGLVVLILCMISGYYLIQSLVVVIRGWPPIKNDPSRPRWEDLKELNNLLASHRRWEERQSMTVPTAPVNRVSVNGNGEHLFEKGAPVT